MVHSVAVPRNRMTIWGRVFSIDVKSLVQSVNHGARQCSLIIEENLITDYQGVTYLGLESGQYAMLFKDTIAPELLQITPKHGETEVSLSVAVTFTFSETVVLGPASKYLKVSLNTLGVDESVTSVTQLEMTPPTVTVAGAQLTVSLNGEVNADSHYSISLPDGAVVDLSQNEFRGLAPRSYSFWTASETRVGQSSTPAGGLSTTSIIGIAIALVILLVIATWAISRFIGMRYVRANYAKTRSSASISYKQGVKPNFIDATSRSPSLRSSATTSPAPPSLLRKATRELASANTGDYQPTSPWEQPPSDPTNRSAPSLHRGRSSDKYKVRCSSSDKGEKASVKSAHHAAARQQQQQTEARRNWHQAFSAARKKKQSVPRAMTSAWPHTGVQQSGGDDHRPKRTEGETSNVQSTPLRAQSSFGQPEGRTHRSSGETQKEHGNGAAPTDSQAEPHATSPRTSQPTAAPPDSSQTPQASNKPTAPRTCSAPAPVVIAGESELERMSKEVVQKMRDLMSAPIAERKKIMRELLFEFHPDKSSNPYAKELCQVINEAKGWFITET